MGIDAEHALAHCFLFTFDQQTGRGAAVDSVVAVTKSDMDEQGIDLVLTQVIPNRFQMERSAWRQPEIGRTRCELLLPLTKTYVFRASPEGCQTLAGG